MYYAQLSAFLLMHAPGQILPFGPK